MRYKKRKLFFPIYFFVVLITLTLTTLSFSYINSLPDNFYTNYCEIENANQSKKFGEFVKLNLEKEERKTGDKKEEENVVIFKLFGFIPIKKIVVKILPEDEVYTGGVPIGLTINTDGAMVISDSDIDLCCSTIHKNKVLRNGDIIKSINGNDVKSLADIDNYLSQSNGDDIEITYLRKDKKITQKMPLLKDEYGKYKLGVWCRDDLSGVGTLTFVKKDRSYAALGHAITNGIYENAIPMTDGNIYSCSLIGINKGEKNKPGELKCVFVNRDAKGDIKKNTKYGIYGHLKDDDNIVDNNLTVKLGGRLSIKPGKAKIISSVSGIREEYEIEIIKANYQTKCDDKSIVFRVKDKRLLDLTGGIVQGMSGSPILQDGKIVGAVTHVFLSDSSKGYGVYCDWMLKQMDF